MSLPRGRRGEGGAAGKMSRSRVAFFAVRVQGVLLEIEPKTGTILKQVNMLSPSSGLVDSLVCDFDDKTGTFYVNAQGAGFFL